MAVTMQHNEQVETDWGRLYRDNAAAVRTLVSGLAPEKLGVPVPASPAWTVRDVAGHLAGGPADVLAGRMDGAPSPEWTARHVTERADRSVAEIMDELDGNVEGVVESLAGNDRPAIAWDIAVHHADLHEALGLGAPPERMWHAVVEAILPADRAAALVDVDDYEIFRGAFSRRSRAQMLAWGSALDAAALDAMCIFGPREDDQPLPG